MQEQIFIGIDAGTSHIKCVAFGSAGEELNSTSCNNEYQTLPGGCVEQNAVTTRDSMLSTLKALIGNLGSDAERVVSIAVTGMGDGMLLVDANGTPLHDGWLWLDSRAADTVAQLEQQTNYDVIFNITGTSLNASQMRCQMLWLNDNQPQLLDKAHTAYHWKDYLYYCLTGVRATDPSEALFTFGSFQSGDYSPEVIKALALTDRAHLLPPIVDGMTQTHPLLSDVASSIGLSKPVGVTLGFVDVICSAMGGGLYNNGALSAMTIMGTTGIHMRYAGSADDIQLPVQKTGYTIAFPGGGYVQLQTNMAATLNIDWILNLGAGVLKAHGHQINVDTLLHTLDEHALKAKPGAALYHPYISSAGERGPFFNTSARASFDGLDQSTAYYDLVRSVIEGMCFAARDCYQQLGEIPAEVRLTGGAAKSVAVKTILASILNRPVRVTELNESGAAGAAMIATMQHGVYDSLESCAQTWLDDNLGKATLPDSSLVPQYDELFTTYLASRKNKMSNGIWEQLSSINGKYKQTNL